VVSERCVVSGFSGGSFLVLVVFHTFCRISLRTLVQTMATRYTMPIVLSLWSINDYCGSMMTVSRSTLYANTVRNRGQNE
jgi:hypothetical protein